MTCPKCNKQYAIFDAMVCEDENGKTLWICPDCEVPLDDVESDDAERLQMAGQDRDAASAAPRLPIGEMIKQGIISAAEGDMPSMPDAETVETTHVLSLPIREKIKQAIMAVCMPYVTSMDMFEEGRPFMDVSDIAEEIARSVTEIIKDGATKEVVIGVHGGVAEPVSVPEGVSVKIRDYDIDGCEGDDLSQDEGGGQCVERNYGAESMVYYVGDEDDGDPC